MNRPPIENKSENLLFRIPMQFKKRGGRKEIITPDGIPWNVRKEKAYQPLAVALARAHYWQELLDQGHFASISDLAEALEVDRSYVGRILRLTLIAPEIVEAILRGEEPSGLSLAKLTSELPVFWSDQQEAW
jgi:ParB-like chromosome segregation protein Spo0J